MCTAHCLVDFIDHRFTQEEVRQLRIELSSPTLFDRLDCFTETARVTVAPAMRDGIEAVGNAHNPRL
jgi:hypothetical protein